MNKLTVEDIVRMRVDFEEITGERPSKISLTHYDYECIRYEIIGDMIDTVVPLPESKDYKGGAKIFGLTITLSDRTVML